MAHTLLNEINEVAREEEELNEAINQAIEILGFNRDEVVCTEAELQRFMVTPSQFPLLELGGDTFRSDVGASRGRGHEMDFVRTMKADQREREGANYKAKAALGLPQKQGRPDKGHRVVLGGGGLGQIVATDAEGGKVMIAVKGGKEFVANADQLAGPKMVGGQPTWALKK